MTADELVEKFLKAKDNWDDVSFAVENMHVRKAGRMVVAENETGLTVKGMCEFAKTNKCEGYAVVKAGAVAVPVLTASTDVNNGNIVLQVSTRRLMKEIKEAFVFKGFFPTNERILYCLTEGLTENDFENEFGQPDMDCILERAKNIARRMNVKWDRVMEGKMAEYLGMNISCDEINDSILTFALGACSADSIKERMHED